MQDQGGPERSRAHPDRGQHHSRAEREEGLGENDRRWQVALETQEMNRPEAGGRDQRRAPRPAADERLPEGSAENDLFAEYAHERGAEPADQKPGSRGKRLGAHQCKEAQHDQRKSVQK